MVENEKDNLVNDDLRGDTLGANEIMLMMIII